MIRAGTIPDSGNPTEVSPAWTMLE